MVHEVTLIAERFFMVYLLALLIWQRGLSQILYKHRALLLGRQTAIPLRLAYLCFLLGQSDRAVHRERLSVGVLVAS